MKFSEYREQHKKEYKKKSYEQIRATKIYSFASKKGTSQPGRITGWK